MTFNINNSSIINFDRSSSFANVSIVNSTTTSSYLGVNDTGYPFQGTSFGYVNARPGNASAIDRFPFVADGSTAISHGSLSVGRYWAAGQSSDVSGYTSGGLAGAPSAINTSNVIDKFPFSSNSGSSDVGDLTITVYETKGHSSKTHGYTSGGTSPPLAPIFTNVIQKFPFASNSNATDVGDLLSPTVAHASHSSTVSGYAAGGVFPTLPPPTTTNVIQKFPFATDANATDVGDLTVARNSAAGHSSPTDGFTSGGSPFPSPLNVIDKFPFATDANATDVGDMIFSRSSHGGLSTTTHGYITGGSNPSYNLPGNPFNTVDRFSFSGSGYMTSGTHNLTMNSAGPHATQQD